MYVINKMSGRTVPKAGEYVCDTIEDVKDLPTEGITPGSSALVIATGQVFILNCSYKWVELGGGSPADSLATANEMEIIDLTNFK